ncbi:MAG: hypothetical protein IT479_08685 [Xanthomonadales bacterium]|nr:hypothetical protein [Xanthomonadales bacterium]
MSLVLAETGDPQDPLAGFGKTEFAHAPTRQRVGLLQVLGQGEGRHHAPGRHLRQVQAEHIDAGSDQCPLPLATMSELISVNAVRLLPRSVGRALCVISTPSEPEFPCSPIRRKSLDRGY